MVTSSKRWKIFYCDGTSFSSDDGQPWESPNKRVAITHTEDGRCGRRTLKFLNYVLWSPTDDRWYEMNDAADVLLRASIEPFLVVRFGLYMPEEDFEGVLIASDNDEFVPRISPDKPAHPAWSRA